MEKPPSPPTVALETPHTDLRGELLNLLRTPVGSVTRITSKEGSVRAQHWHREDSHYCYVESGVIEYLERPVGSDEKPTRHVYGPGSMFWTGPQVEHAMLFRADTVFYCFADRHRTQEDYEKDLVRLTTPLA